MPESNDSSQQVRLGATFPVWAWNSTVVRLVTIILAIVIPAVSVIPTLLIYFLLGYLLPETDEF
jgi:phage shock protein PspC (stress-responsive transcriptional regulator)